MKKSIFIITIFSISFFGCEKIKKKEDIELIVFNKELISYDYRKNIDTVNYIFYSIRNNSNEIYFINNLVDSKKLLKNSIYVNGLNVLIYDSYQKEVFYKKNYQETFSRNSNCYESIVDDFLENKVKLGHKIKFQGLYNHNNLFFIYPNQTIYFSNLLSFKKPVSFNEVRKGFVDLESNSKFHAKISIASDSTNYKNVLPKEILKTIEVNHAKVYHGVIESNNKVPIKVIN